VPRTLSADSPDPADAADPIAGALSPDSADAVVAVDPIAGALSPESADAVVAVDSIAGALSPESADAVVTVDAVPDGVTLSELAARLPISRASVFEVIKALGIATARGPGPGGRGRVAWLSAGDAQRVEDAANAVHRREIRISDLAQCRQSRPTRQTLPGAALTASAESGDHVDAARLQARLRAAELAISSGLGLSTAEAAWILGARPSGAMVTRGRVTATRAGFNCWVLTASGESGGAVD